MTVYELPSFDEAEGHVQSFLRDQGHPSNLCWIFREDVVERGLRRFIRVPLVNRRDAAAQLYEYGVERGLGISLEVYDFLEKQPLCFVWVPSDEKDASYRMLSGLKIAVPSGSGPWNTKGVKSRLYWKWLKMIEPWGTRHQWADQIPHLPSSPP